MEQTNYREVYPSFEQAAERVGQQGPRGLKEEEKNVLNFNPSGDNFNPSGDNLKRNNDRMMCNCKRCRADVHNANANHNTELILTGGQLSCYATSSLEALSRR